MWRFLFLLTFMPAAAAAAGLDITADELTQDSYGTVIASGNVVIKQRPVRTLRHMRITPIDWHIVRADFDQTTEPTDVKPKHKRLTLNKTAQGWKIISEQSLDAADAEEDMRPYPSIEDALASWRKAWSEQKQDQYFSAYSDQFRPDSRFASQADWRSYKKRAIANKQYIRVKVEGIRIQPLKSDQMQVEFIQYYDSDRGNSRDIKRLIFGRADSGWKILRETVIDTFSIAADINSQESPEQAISAWKNAWNRRDLQAYTNRYAADAYPVQQYPTRQAWLNALQANFAKTPERSMTADRVKFNRQQHSIRAEGHVQMQSAEGRIQAESAEIDSETHAGTIEQATLYLPNGERLQAKKLTRVNDTLFEAHDARFSTCSESDEAWALQADTIRLDQQQGEVTARHTKFEIAGVPVLYSPWWSQPLKRKSGLLTPKVATSKRRGTELGLPLYLAPSTDLDATLTPTWMSARGVMGEVELRHISKLGSERIDVAGINDSITGSARSRLQGDIKWQLPGNIALNIKADHVSDHLYMADYATGSDASKRYLESTATLSRSYVTDSLRGDWMLMGQHQQDLTLTSNATVLHIQPRLESHLQWAPLSNTYLHFDQQTTRFARSSGIDGWRMDLHPYIEIPWKLEGGGISATLQAGSHHTRYWLQDTVLPAQQQRTSGEASLELRSDFERISADKTWRHQISPILRYDYIGVSDQTNMANFDSTFGRLTWSNLLNGNRFTGRDRIERINRISMMLETRWQHKDGLASREFLMLRAGAAYDMLRQSVDPIVQPAATRPFSNLLAEFALTPVDGFRLFASGQYNSADRYWATLTSRIDVTAGIVRLQAGYQFTDARYALAAQLINLSGSIRLGQRWQASGKWVYDNLIKLTQQATLGLKYSHPCWSLGLEGYRLNRPNGTARNADYGVQILLEFKGLGSVGSS